MVMLPQYERHVLGWHQLRGVKYAAQRNHTANTTEPMLLTVRHCLLTALITCFFAYFMIVMSKLYSGGEESR